MAASTALEENFNRKLEVVTSGLPKEYLGLLNRIPKEDAMTVMNYMVSQNAEVNPSENSKSGRHHRFSKSVTKCPAVCAILIMRIKRYALWVDSF